MYLARLKEDLFNHLIHIGRRLRRIVSRSEWVIRLLSLPRSEASPDKPGLILIQIDGLSRTQIERAIRNGRMPFVSQLLQEGHQLLSFYSGLPSTTPAVQGELFYGVRTVVPAFSFRDHATHQIVSMLSSASASHVEEQLRESGDEPLLQGGSVYCDMYRGGAEKASFCSSTPGVDTTLRRANPWTVSLAFLLHGVIVLRMIALFGIEVVLAIIDLARGLIERKKLIKELTFIPYRLLVCILLRELVTAGIILDVALGFPVVHCNFLGYDEQSHRRGPSSAFAHWTLKGIDDCLKRIWRFAQSTAQRDYDIWIYSDHGQEAAQPYEIAEGRTIEAAITEQLQKLDMETRELSATVNTIQLKRVGWLGGDLLQRLLNSKHQADSDKRLEVTANGPVGHLYLPSTLSFESRKKLGKALAEEVHIPVVMMRDEADNILVWTRSNGQSNFPGDAMAFLGENHPFFDEVCRDIPALVRHPNAGMFVLFGWGAGEQSMNFGIENGGHAGFGPEETRGFAVLSQDVPLPFEQTDFVRPSDLRETVLRYLGRTAELETTVVPSIRARRNEQALRVMTYNVHSCMGMDGTVSPQRIARILAMYAPDIVALQEVDVNRSRTGRIDQAQQIAKLLNMEYHFHPSFTIAEEHYGNSVLSRFPLRVVKTGTLPGKLGLEPRGILWLKILWNDRPVHLFVTHLGLRRRERQVQIMEILGKHWLAHPDCQYPIIVCADLNASPMSGIYRDIRQVLHDTAQSLDRQVNIPTWMGMATVDYIFASSEWEVLDRTVPRNYLTRKASDHMPVIVDLHIP
jgi:endonuclease/exonuclease/phosphatase family metal-dependent hydrolase